jgi:hypothetical protein
MDLANIQGETGVVTGCSVSLSVFTVDYDAPKNSNTTEVIGHLSSLTGSK